MKPIVHIMVLILCMVFVSSLDAGRFILLDENGNPIEGEPTCQRCEDFLANCPSGFFCACGCTEDEREEEREKRRRAELQNLFNENNAGLKNIYSECMTDIYFGNGVWNDEFGAKDGMIALFGEFLETNRYDKKIHHFGLAYNKGHISQGTFDDIIETFWQLKESGQIGSLIGYSEAMYRIINYAPSSLTTIGLNSFREYVLSRLPDIKSDLETNYGTMFTKYQNFSFKNGHRVLLVAHSQGNLFGNYMYDRFSWQRDYFRMIGVGTPANHVAGGGPHITVYGDYVIAPIPNRLSLNTPGTGHTFIGTYLTESAGDKLNSYLLSADSALGNISTQWDVASKTNEENCQYRIELEHKHKNQSSLQNLKSVYPFDIEKGKVYTADNSKVMGHCGGNKINIFACDNSEASLCYELNGTSDTIEVSDKDLDTKSGFEVSLNDGGFVSYTEDTFKTIAHDESQEFPYQNYHFDVKYDENSTGRWIAEKHQTQQWNNMCGDVLRIGNNAHEFQAIHRGINMCVEINDGSTTCFAIKGTLPCCFGMFGTELEEIEAEATGICSYSTCQW